MAPFLEESAAKIQHGGALRKLMAAKEASEQWATEGDEENWQDAVKAKTNLSDDYIFAHSQAIKAGVRELLLQTTHTQV